MARSAYSDPGPAVWSCSLVLECAGDSPVESVASTVQQEALPDPPDRMDTGGIRPVSFRKEDLQGKQSAEKISGDLRRSHVIVCNPPKALHRQLGGLKLCVEPPLRLQDFY